MAGIKMMFRDLVAEDVERVTKPNNVDENWDDLMQICDKAGESNDSAKSYLKATMKRLFNKDAHVALQAITLLDTCIKNSGRRFQLEVASREFENDFIKLMQQAHPTVAKKLRLALKRWAENEFRDKSDLSLIPGLYAKLKNQGFDFEEDTHQTRKNTSADIRNPDAVESQEEEEQIAKALELSLRETTRQTTNTSPKSTATAPTTSTASSLYPSANLLMASGTSTVTPSYNTKEPKKVRALYDFEAAEDNELTFNSGEIIFVLDDTDANWWKGSNQRGEGLFPANFVTADLSVHPEQLLEEKLRVLVEKQERLALDDQLDAHDAINNRGATVKIDETKIDNLLHILHEADPTSLEKDPLDMLQLEAEVHAMGPLIDAELEAVDRKHSQLAKLSADLVEALGLYHTLMREPVHENMGTMPSHIPYSHSTLPKMMPNYGHPTVQTFSHGQPTSNRVMTNGNTANVNGMIAAPTSAMMGTHPNQTYVMQGGHQTMPPQNYAPHGVPNSGLMTGARPISVMNVAPPRAMGPPLASHGAPTQFQSMPSHAYGPTPAANGRMVGQQQFSQMQHTGPMMQHHMATGPNAMPVTGPGSLPQMSMPPSQHTQMQYAPQMAPSNNNATSGGNMSLPPNN